MSDIFVSFSHHDREVVDRIVTAFEQGGCTVDWDNRLVPGERYNGTLPARVAKAGRVVVLWSANSIESSWVQREARIAAELRTLAPLTLELLELPEEFADVHTVQAADSRQLDALLPDFVRAVGASARQELDAGSQVANDVRRAFHQRRLGDFEGATDHLRDALRRFEVVLDDPDFVEHRNADRYKAQTIRVLSAMSSSGYCGELMRTLAGESLLPVIDAVLQLKTQNVVDRLDHQGCVLQKKYRRRKYVRAGIVIRPGIGVDDGALVEKLLNESTRRPGPLQVDCFLLIMSTTGGVRGDQFSALAHRRGLDARCIEWQPDVGDDDLEQQLLNTASKLCEDAA